MYKHFTLILLMVVAFNAAAEEIKQKFAGLTVNAELMMADGKTFKDDFVLITHGTLTHKGRSTYSGLQKLLAQEYGISSLAINLSLGLDDRHGEYPCDTPHTHKHTDAAKEIDLWLHWLESQGTKKISLIGHSRGGNQTARFLTEIDSPIVDKAVLIAPQTWNAKTVSEEYQKKYNASLSKLYTEAEKLVKAGKGNTLIKNIGFIYCQNTSATATAIVDYYQNDINMDTPTLLEKVKKPVLVIIGSDDKVVADLPEKMAKVSNPEVTFVTIQDANHFFLDFAAEDLASTISDFINE